MTSEIFPRRLSEIDEYRGEKIAEGHFLYISPERRNALLHNPYLEGSNEICEWVGYADGKCAGFNYSFPIRVWADGKSYRSTTGSSLNVEDWARKSDLGLILPAKGVEETGKDGIAIAAACSQVAIPLHKINGYRYFFLPRFIAVWKSRSVIESVVPQGLSLPFIWVADVLLWLYANILRLIAGGMLRRYYVAEARADNGDSAKEMADIVSCDTRRFREDHDAAWFKWHMTCSFSNDGPCKGYLLRERRTGKIMAFALAKRRFHEVASHRGFKNVWLGSIVEWGNRPGGEKTMKWFVLSVALRFAHTCDAVEFSPDDERLQSFIRSLGWQHVGESNVGVKVMKNFPFYGDKSVREQSNWRVRPGMGDNALS